MDTLVLPVMLFIAGAFNVGLAGRALVNPAFARSYAESSPKAALWRKWFGVERTARLVRAVFAPIGMALGLCLIAGGGILLLR